MEIAKLFASVGFRVDTKNIDAFEARLSGAQVKIVNFANTIDTIGTKASQAITPVNNLIRSLNFKGSSTGIAPLSNALERLDATVRKIDMQGFHAKIQQLGYALDESRPKINRSANAWERYAEAVERSRRAVVGSWGRGTPPNPPSGVGGLEGAVIGGAIGSRYTSSPHYTPQSRLLAPMVGSHLAYLASGGVMAGVGAVYATKATLDRAQENMTAENFVKMASANKKEFEENKKWLWERSMYYGTDINANMEGFGKIYMNTSDSLGRDKSLKVIEDIMKYNTSMHTSREAQKFINKSLYQMAGTAQVNAQDYNQWEEHVAGGQKVAGRALDILAEEKGGKYENWRKYGTAKKAISEIQIEGKDLVPALTQAMAEASEKGLETGRTGYQAESARFQNRVTAFAREIADKGLFDMAKAFFKLLGTIMDLLQAMMPVWVSIAQAMGGFFTVLSDGLELLVIGAKNLSDFVHWVFTAGEETWALRAVLTGLAVSTLPLVLAGFKKFMTAVTALMWRNPITAALLVILSLFGFLYGQWKRQQQGLSNWLDFFSAVLYLVKEIFLMGITAMQLAFWKFVNAMIDGFNAIPNLIRSVFDSILERIPLLEKVLSLLQKMSSLGDEEFEKEKERDVQRRRMATPIPMAPLNFPQSYTNIPPTIASPNRRFGFDPATVQIVDPKGKPLGKTQIRVAQASN